MSLLPPPCDEFTIREPFFKATRVRPPGVVYDDCAAKVNGLKSNSIYHLYRDSYKNHVEITTDENGEYKFEQDTSEEHHVWIQEHPSTIYIEDDATGGGCSTFGTWAGWQTNNSPISGR